MVDARAWPFRPRWDQGTCGTDDLQQHTQHLLGGEALGLPEMGTAFALFFGAVAGMTRGRGGGGAGA